MNAATRASVYIGIGAVAACVVVVPILLNQQADLKREIGLERSNAEARADTTRRLVLALGVLAADAQALQRRAVQEKLRADKLDVAAHQQPKTQLDLAVSIPSVDTTARGQTAESTGDVRDIRFDSVTAGPFTLDAQITSPPFPQQAIGRFHIGLAKPVAIQIRLGCGERVRANNNVRPASVLVTAPKWLHAEIDLPRVDDAVCNAPRQRWATDWRTLGLTALTLFVALRH